MAKIDIRVAHSPDSDDAFMFYALARDKINTGEYRFTHTLEDIESLNQKALEQIYEVSAVSIHAYAYIADSYVLLPCGASMGDQYGPILVSREPCTLDDVATKRIAVPGTMTTAFLTLRLLLGDPHFEVRPFDQIMKAVRDGKVDAGLLIHEGQLTYAQHELHKVVDLGVWWHEQTGLPLPLGGNVIRRDLGTSHIRSIGSLIQDGIRFSLNHRQDALAYALQYAGDLKPEEADRFVGMYVNDWTLDYGEKGRRAVRLLLHQAHEKGIIPHPVTVEFADEMN